MAFGRDSRTTPSTSIISSFDTLIPSLIGFYCAAANSFSHVRSRLSVHDVRAITVAVCCTCFLFFRFGFARVLRLPFASQTKCSSAATTTKYIPASRPAVASTMLPCCHSIQFPPLWPCQDDWTILCDCNLMFEMGGKTAVSGHNRPAILQNSNGIAFLIDHGFNAECHTRHQTHTMSRLSVIRNFRIFVHFPSDSVAAIFPNNAIAPFGTICFHCMTNVTKSCTDLCRCNGFKQTCLCYRQQIQCFLRNISNRKRSGIISNETVQSCPNVYADDVAAFAITVSADGKAEFSVEVLAAFAVITPLIDEPSIEKAQSPAMNPVVSFRKSWEFAAGKRLGQARK